MTLRPIRRTAGGVLLTCMLMTTACAENLDGTPPPVDVFYFPLGLSLSEDGTRAYVVNSNFDLRFNSGWLSTVDLQAVVESGQSTIDPVADGFENIIAAQLRIPALGGVVATREGLLYVAHRSDRLISVIEETGGDDGLPACGERADDAGLSSLEARTDCDRDHLFELRGDAAEQSSTGDSDLSDLDVSDPFALLVGANTGGDPFLLAGQLSIGRLNAISIVPQARFLCLGTYDQSQATDAELPDSCFVEGAVTTYGRSESLLTGRFNQMVPVPVSPDATEPYNFMAVAGRVISGSSERSGIVHIDLDSYLAGEEDFGEQFPIGNEVGGIELSDIAFSPDGAFAYGAARVTQRTAGGSARGAVYRLDASLEPIERIDEAGERVILRRPRYAVEAITSLRGQPSGVLYIERAGQSDLIVVTDLDQDTLFVLDAESAEMPILGRVDVPGGPFEMALTQLDGREYVVITQFYDHGLALVDVSSDNPVDYRLAFTIRNGELGVAERAR